MFFDFGGILSKFQSFLQKHQPAFGTVPDAFLRRCLSVAPPFAVEESFKLSRQGFNNCRVTCYFEPLMVEHARVNAFLDAYQVPAGIKRQQQAMSAERVSMLGLGLEVGKTAYTNRLYHIHHMHLNARLPGILGLKWQSGDVKEYATRYDSVDMTSLDDVRIKAQTVFDTRALMAVTDEVLMLIDSLQVGDCSALLATEVGSERCSLSVSFRNDAPVVADVIVGINRVASNNGMDAQVQERDVKSNLNSRVNSIQWGKAEDESAFLTVYFTSYLADG